MNCQQARLLIGAAPYGTSPELEEHLHSCAACGEFRAQMVALEGNIRSALERSPLLASDNVTERDRHAVSPASVVAIDAATATRKHDVSGVSHVWRGWALAASVLLTLGATMAVWLLRPEETLARQIATHVSGEPLSWNSTEPVNAAYLQRVLHNGGVDSQVTSSEVVYAQTCLFRGHFVPHLVVQTASGPVTVMILPNEHVSSRQSFYEGGFAGVIVPAQHGSIAVLARGSANIDDIAGQMRHTFQSAAAK